MLNSIIRFFLENKLLTIVLLLLFLGWGLATAPFTWSQDWLPRDPVAVDAIPDLGENQQIVFTEWKGRSPQDIEDQITYPLTTVLLGVPGVRTVRSSSMFGISSIYVIFEEGVDFYWARSRVQEKINSLPKNLLPSEVQPRTGPEATALGQVFWYTLEGRDSLGRPTGGWDPQELRSIQDFYVRQGLASASGVAEVASVGGFTQEFQVDVDPIAMRAQGVTFNDVMRAVQQSNLDVGARTLELNRVEYFIRGLGYVQDKKDIESTVIKVNRDIPVRIADVARVNLGPAPRRGALDKSGAEAVGGVVVAAFGENPLEVIDNVKDRIASIVPGMPQKTLEDGTVSKVTLVPFYDRSTLIYETLGTLEEALSLEILVTIIVILLMIMNLRTSLLISGLLPLSVLMCFIAMRYLGVDANIVALSGIAIAIGTMVDVGIVMSENIVRHIDSKKTEEPLLETVYRATTEVAGAVVTAIATTIVSFLPVFTLTAAEGKLFRPLAFTKTFALLASIVTALVILPALAHWLFSLRISSQGLRRVLGGAALLTGLIMLFFAPLPGLMLIIGGLSAFADLLSGKLPEPWQWLGEHFPVFLFALFAVLLLGRSWLPLGPESGLFLNLLFTGLIIFALISFFYLFMRFYPRILSWCLEHKAAFLAIPVVLILWGLFAWQGTETLLKWIPEGIRTSRPFVKMKETFPGMGEEFMPALDEGSFLLMPSSMPHAGMEENREVLSTLDMAVQSIPEVETVVGKMGRAETALDPAPVSMYENIILYKPEYITDADGNPIRFKVDDQGAFLRDAEGALIEDPKGLYFRNWRDHIRSPQDIWDEISAIELPGVTPAPKLQPIETRLVMLQTGMRAPMGLRIKGPDLPTIEAFGLRMEEILSRVKGVKKGSVFADRIVGKPYLNVRWDRDALARYNISIQNAQMQLEMGLGGMPLTTTVKGRERYDIRVRYPREYRDDPKAIEELLIPSPQGMQLPLGDLAVVEYERGPQMIKSEDAFLIGYVLFDKVKGAAEVDVVERAQATIDSVIAAGGLEVPAGVTYEFAGTYENQVRATKTLMLVVPLALVLIFLILYFQFRSAMVAAMIFTGIFTAFAGGFILLWLYNQPWFMDFSLFGTNLRELFHIGPVNLSVAVWVGFIALFGIATDDGVVMATYIRQTLRDQQPRSAEEVRKAVLQAGRRRIRPCLMTTATTLLALLPVLSSSGRGADIMIPMAIPVFGGMLVELITLFIIPVLYSMWMEARAHRMNVINMEEAL